MAGSWIVDPVMGVQFPLRAPLRMCRGSGAGFPKAGFRGSNPCMRANNVGWFEIDFLLSNHYDPGLCTIAHPANGTETCPNSRNALVVDQMPSASRVASPTALPTIKKIRISIISEEL